MWCFNFEGSLKLLWFRARDVDEKQISEISYSNALTLMLNFVSYVSFHSCFFCHQVVHRPYLEQLGCAIGIDVLHCGIRSVIVHIFSPYFSWVIEQTRVIAVIWDINGTRLPVISRSRAVFISGFNCDSIIAAFGQFLVKFNGKISHILCLLFDLDSPNLLFKKWEATLYLSAREKNAFKDQWKINHKLIKILDCFCFLLSRSFFYLLFLFLLNFLASSLKAPAFLSVI